jgi:site-specific DNA-methyltransferase (adenine-specific)
MIYAIKADKYTKIGDATLFNADCFDVFPSIPDNSIDAIIADLPYGTTACKWDSILPFDKLWESYERIIKPNGAIVLFGSQPFTSALIMSNPKLFKYEWIWFKNVPTGMAQASFSPMKYHENIIVFCNGKISTFNKQFEKREGNGKSCYRYEHYCGESNHVKMKKVKKFYDPFLVNPSSVVLFSSVPNRKGKVHPTQKPVALLEYIVKTYTNEGETVLDNTMGSGTTGVACLNTNRKFIGIEKDQQYYQVAVNRLNTQRLTKT